MAAKMMLEAYGDNGAEGVSFRYIGSLLYCGAKALEKTVGWELVHIRTGDRLPGDEDRLKELSKSIRHYD